jgi:release factor glutamine methyltransferase
MLTLIEVVKKTSDFFASKGIESPRLNAELLVGHALGLPRMRLYIEFERPVSDAELGRVRELVRRRGRREPVQHIIGYSDFCGLRLKTDRRALIPRPETELLVETVAARCAAPPGRILDLGTGGGSIALALARAFPTARVTAADASLEALSLAAENAEAAGVAERVTFVESDWFERLPAGECYDLIISNPPYLSEEETAAAAPEVRDHDPARALTAADGGFADIEKIVSGAAGSLAPGGMLALEMGIGHRARLEEALVRAGFSRIEPHADLAGRDRFILAWR